MDTSLLLALTKCLQAKCYQPKDMAPLLQIKNNFANRHQIDTMLWLRYANASQILQYGQQQIERKAYLHFLYVCRPNGFGLKDTEPIKSYHVLWSKPVSQQTFDRHNVLPALCVVLHNYITLSSGLCLILFSMSQPNIYWRNGF